MTTRPTSEHGPARFIAMAAFAIVLAVIATFVSLADGVSLRDGLRHWQFWALEAQALLAAALTLANLRTLASLVAARASHIGAVALIACMGWALAAGVAPRTSRIYYDEQIYQGVAQGLTDAKLAQICNEGTVEYGTLQCWRWEYNKQPYGYPYLLSVAYRLVGVREGVAFTLNAFSVFLLVWVVFATTAMLAGATAGVFAALVIALIPVQLAWSNTAAVEPSAALTAAAAVMAAIAFTRSRRTSVLWWAGVLAVFAAQFRPESVLVWPIVVVIVLAARPGEILRARFWTVATACLGLAAVLVAHVVAVSGEGWGTTGDRVSLDFVRENLAVNGWFYIWDERFPALYSGLAVFGAVVAGIRRAIPPLVYFAAFWGIFLLFYAGSYSYGADVRYSLMTYPPLAMLAGVGAVSVARGLASSRAWSMLRSAVAVAAGLAVAFLWFLPGVRSTGEEAWGARADVRFARDAASALPPNAIVLTHVPTMFHVWGVNAAQLSLATTDTEYVRGRLFSRYAGGVYVHWSFWCNVTDPVQHRYCTESLDRFPNRLVRESREREYRYAFYQLSPPEGQVPTPPAVEETAPLRHTAPGQE